MRSWLEVPAGSDFPLQNLPFGMGHVPVCGLRALSRIGDQAINLAALAEWGYLKGTGIPGPDIFRQETLNPFISLGKPVWSKVRERLLEIFSEDNAELRDHSGARARCLVPVDVVTMAMPVQVGDYTDFYASIDHATNVGKMFRDPEHALLPNWKHLPVGYHGRSSSIVVSGAGIHRPNGQRKPPDEPLPVFGPSTLLDFELEVGFIVGRQTAMGETIPVNRAEQDIFGLVLFNDLSARDIQSWEYVPLGPFLAKNFGSVISPWVVTLEALQPFRVPGPRQDPPVLPYLRHEQPGNFDIRLEVYLQPEGSVPSRICSSNFRHMYWSMAQMLAHHTVNGCNMRVGDLLASGTISGPEPDSYGSMLELSWRGTRPLKLADGQERRFLEDMDQVIMKGYAEMDGLRIGFGECRTTLLPSKSWT
ncbi:MAG TPA: fumarylacetoacetase [Bacteroidales bacterium]|nr:fumarylacetoacetase [Bacteroidales bacterium]